MSEYSRPLGDTVKKARKKMGLPHHNWYNWNHCRQKTVFLRFTTGEQR